MGNIYVEFTVNEPANDSEAREHKTQNVRALLTAKLDKLHYVRDTFDGRERWKVYFTGEGGLDHFATTLHNDLTGILSGTDVILVSVSEAN